MLPILTTVLEFCARVVLVPFVETLRDRFWAKVIRKPTDEEVEMYGRAGGPVALERSRDTGCRAAPKS